MSIALSLVFVLSFILQFILMEKYKIIAVGSLGDDLSAAGLGKSHIFRAVLGSFHAPDFAIIIGFFALFAWIVAAQVRRGTLSVFLSWIVKSEWRTRAAVLGVSLLFLKSMLAPGEPYFMDAPSHVSRAWFAFVNFAQGYVFPTFNNYYHAGFAMFSHYGFLFSVLAGGANLVLHDINLAVKLTMFLVSVANAYVFYALGKQLSKDRAGGLLLSLIVTASNLILYAVLWTGALFYPLVLSGAGLLLLSYERFLAEAWKAYRSAFVAAIGANILIATHLGYAAQILLFFLVYAAARFLTAHRGDWRRIFGFAAAAAAIGAVLSAFVVLPTFLDMRDVNFYKGFPFSESATYEFWRQPLWQMLMPRPFFSDYLDYLGLGLVGTALFLGVRAAARPDRRITGNIISIVASIIVLGYARNTLLLFLAVALFVIQAYALCVPGDQGKRRLYAVIVLALLADALAFNNFNTFRNNDFEHRVYDRLSRETWGEKLGVVKANSLHGGNKPDNNVYVSPWLKITGHLVVQPNAIMLEANKQALYQFEVTHDLLGLDMLNGKITVPTLQALQMVGVRYLTFNTSDAYYIPPVETEAPVVRNAAGPWIELPGTFPMLFSERVSSFDGLAANDHALSYRSAFEADNVSHDNAPLRYRDQAGAYVHRLVELTGTSLSQPIADRFIARVLLDADLRTPGAASLVVNSFTVDAQKVVAEFTINKPGFVRIPFGWFRWHRISLDGSPEASFPDAMNMICVRVDTAGNHRLQVGPSLSPARRAGAWITGGSFLVLLFLFAAIERRSSGPSRSPDELVVHEPIVGKDEKQD